MLAVFHSIDTLNGMKMPGCCNRHKMNIPSLTNFFPFIFPSRIAIRLMVGTADSLFRTFNPVGFQIAKGLDLHTFDTCQSPCGACTPVTQANDCHAHCFNRRGCIAEIGRASCRERVYGTEGAGAVTEEGRERKEGAEERH